jgi:hypothetical protein
MVFRSEDAKLENPCARAATPVDPSELMGNEALKLR